MKAEHRSALPLRLEHYFQLWSYSKSHCRLVLRAWPGEEYDRFIDVIFTSVRGMMLVPSYQGLSVSCATDVTRIDEFVKIPSRHEHRCMKLDVSDQEHRGFVVCGRVDVRHGVRRYPRGGEGQKNSGGSTLGTAAD